MIFFLVIHWCAAKKDTELQSLQFHLIWLKSSNAGPWGQWDSLHQFQSGPPKPPCDDGHPERQKQVDKRWKGQSMAFQTQGKTLRFDCCLFQTSVFDPVLFFKMWVPNSTKLPFEPQQDNTCFVCGTEHGFRVYSTDPFNLTFRREVSTTFFSLVDRGSGTCAFNGATTTILCSCDLKSLKLLQSSDLLKRHVSIKSWLSTGWRRSWCCLHVGRASETAGEEQKNCIELSYWPAMPKDDDRDIVKTYMVYHCVHCMMSSCHISYFTLPFVLHFFDVYQWFGSDVLKKSFWVGPLEVGSSSSSMCRRGRLHVVG